tara:strand:- start:70 stop:273 length:204 start_codon:yes stop_codon:yes gene_type:complete
MATSDQILSALSDLKIDYESSPNDDGLEDKANFHYSLLQLLQAIEYNQRIANEMYRIKNGLSAVNSD